MKIERERLCAYSSPYPGRSVARKIIEFAAREELGGVELMSFCEELGTPDRAAARELGKMARGAGLSLPCFSVGIDAIAHPDESLRRLRGYAEICSELEIPLLHHTIALDFKCGRLPVEERERRFAIGATVALSLAEYSATLGVKTIIEDQGFVFNGIAGCDRLCRLSDERIGIVADFGNVLFVNEAPEDFIRAMGPRIRHAHIKDYSTEAVGAAYTTADGTVIHDCEIGTGMLDLDSIFTTLDEVGYRGSFGIEFAAVKDQNEVKRVLDRLTY